MSNLYCIHTSPATPLSNSFHPALSEILATIAEGTRVLFSLCFYNLPPSPLLWLRSGLSTQGLCCSPGIYSAHTISRLYATASRTDLDFQVTLDTRCQQQTLPHQPRGRQGRALVWVQLPGTAAFPGHFSLSHRNHIPLTAHGCRKTTARGLRQGTKGTQLEKG